MYTDLYYKNICHMFTDEHIKKTDVTILLTYIDKKYTNNNGTLLHICIQNFKKYHMVTDIIGGPYLYLTNLVGFIIIQIDW